MLFSSLENFLHICAGVLYSTTPSQQLENRKDISIFYCLTFGNAFFFNPLRKSVLPVPSNKTGVNWGKFVKICQNLPIVQAGGRRTFCGGNVHLEYYQYQQGNILECFHMRITTSCLVTWVISTRSKCTACGKVYFLDILFIHPVQM